MLTLILATAQSQPAPEIIRIPMAAHDLPVGHRIADEDIELHRFLPDFVAATTAVKPGDVVGRVVRETVYEGEVFRLERLTPEVRPAGLQSVIPDSMELVRLEPSGQVPAIAPGAWVDVLDGTRGCAVAQAAPILGVEGADGTVHTRITPESIAAWHLAFVPEEAERVKALSTWTLAVRHETDFVAIAEIACDPIPDTAD